MAILGTALFGTSILALFFCLWVCCRSRLHSTATGFVIHFQMKVKSNIRYISEVTYPALLVYALTLLIGTVFCTLNGWVPAGSSI